MIDCKTGQITKRKLLEGIRWVDKAAFKSRVLAKQFGTDNISTFRHNIVQTGLFHTEPVISGEKIEVI